LRGKKGKLGVLITCNKRKTSAFLNPWAYGVNETFKGVKNKRNSMMTLRGYTITIPRFNPLGKQVRGMYNHGLSYAFYDFWQEIQVENRLNPRVLELHQSISTRFKECTITIHKFDLICFSKLKIND
jgi:hypothetical protein